MAAERGAALTGGLLAFARRQPLSPRAVDLNAAIAGMNGLLHSALGPRMKIEIRQHTELWPAMIDPTQFELLILNLVINARDAMPEGGVVTIETDNTRRGPPMHAEDPPEGIMSSSLCAIPVSAWRPKSRPERSNRSLRPNRPAPGRGLVCRKFSVRRVNPAAASRSTAHRARVPRSASICPGRGRRRVLP